MLDKKFDAIAGALELHDMENSFETMRNIRAAVAGFAAGRGALDVGTIACFVRAALEAGIKAGRALQAREAMREAVR